MSDVTINQEMYMKLCEELKPYLMDVLAKNGVQPIKNSLCCINPSHDDSNYDMSIKNNRLYCHCMEDMRGHRGGYDAFDAYAALVHKIPDIDRLTPAERVKLLLECCDYCGVIVDNYTISHTKTPTQQYPNQTPEEQKKKQEKLRYYAKQDIIKAQQNTNCAFYVDYLKRRNLDIDVCKKYRIGAIGNNWIKRGKDGKTQYADTIIVPTGTGEFTHIAKIANNELVKSGLPKTLNKPFGEGAQLFNYSNAIKASEFYIVEGWEDAMSIIQYGKQAISLNSCSNDSLLIKALERDLRALDGKCVYLCCDNDINGYNANCRLDRALKSLEAKAKQDNISFTHKIINLMGDYNDANESCINEPEEFMNAVINNTHRPNKNHQQLIEQATQTTDAAMQPQQPTVGAIGTKPDEKQIQIKGKSISALITSYMDDINKRKNTTAIDTGFSRLNEVLDDGLYEGLYVLIGGTGGGKTAFSMQLAEQVSKRGYPVLYIALEMSWQELVSRAQSRHTFIQCQIEELDYEQYGKTARQITNKKKHQFYTDKEKDIIEKALTRVFEHNKNLYIEDGLGDISATDIREMMQKYKELLGKAPLLIVDYLQILEPLDYRVSDKTNNDRAILELKRISRDYETPVIALSSTQREKYGKPISEDSAKESGAIEYSSDVVFGLEFDGADEPEVNKDTTKTRQRDTKKSTSWMEERKAEYPRRMQLKIIKNRYGGVPQKVFYNFYPNFSHMDEVGVMKNVSRSKTQPAPKPKEEQKSDDATLFDDNGAKTKVL